MPFPIDFSSPQVVAPVCNSADLDFLSSTSAAHHCDIIELRLDSLSDQLDPIETLLSDHHPNLPILATARHPDEGGDGSLDAAARQQLYARFLPQIDALDIELRSVDEMSDTLEAARSAGKKIILSFHDFKSTPSISTIQDKIEAAIDAEADVCKIAVHLDSLDRLCELAQVCENETRIKISLMGMGPLGKISRLLFAKAGSALNYGYLATPNAPGQWPAKQLKNLIGEI
ncbi:MAG: type I 3-dehydroquinate dehydratase [Verrucomicrobiales bacterium]|nr:type I 3-dehydroquinate dehydratase [Verrucomicrobiales bacterium]